MKRIPATPAYYQPWADVKRHEGCGLPWRLSEGRTYRRLVKKQKRGGKR